MSYSRLPRAGLALKQNPTDASKPGIQLLTFDSEISTTSSLGVVQVGGGLSITPEGVLSATGGESGPIVGTVTLTNVNYTATSSDYYIGATKKDIDITLPLGAVGQVYVVKNQGTGSVKLQGTGGQLINSSTFKSLGSEEAITIIFANARWNII